MPDDSPSSDLADIAAQLRWEASQLRDLGVLAVRPSAERLEALAEQYENAAPWWRRWFRRLRGWSTGN